MKKTRQRITLALMTAMIALLFTGCVKFDTSITIKKDGRIDLDMIYAVQDDSGSYLEEYAELIDDIKAQSSSLAALGITCEDYCENGYTGVRLTGNNLKLSRDIESEFSDLPDFDGDFLSYSVDGNKVSIIALQYDSYTGGSYSKEYGSLISMSGASATIRITFPEGTNVVNSNATSVSYDGLTYTWDLLQLDYRDGLRVDFEMPMTASVSLIYALIGGGIGAVVIIAVIVVILVKYNKKQKAEAAARMYAYGQNTAVLPNEASDSAVERNETNQP